MMVKRKTNRRPQTQKARGIRPRSVVFEDEKHLADVEAARGKNWFDEQVLDEIENWEDYV